MIEMINNSFYESKSNFPLIKRKASDQKREIWTVKKLSFSRKCIAKMFSVNVFVSECIFKLVCFCECCRNTRKVYSLKNLWADFYLYGLSSRFLFVWLIFTFSICMAYLHVFLIAMLEIDTAADVYFELFQTCTLELFCLTNKAPS